MSGEEKIDVPEVETNQDGILDANQFKILAILAAYTNGEVEAGQNESWIRRIALLTLAFEGVMAKVLDYDYAPASLFHAKTYLKVNISQQFLTDLDELVLEGHVRAIKLTTRWHSSGMAYQISAQGIAHLKAGFEGGEVEDEDDEEEKEAKAPKSYKELTDEVDSFTLGKNGGRMQADYVPEERCFYLSGDGKPPRQSDVTDTEDVSYVSSPWVPNSLVDNIRSLGSLKSNSHRAKESAGTENQIKDELDELIALNNTHVLVCEFVPFGSNQIFALNDKLGAFEKLQGGLFLASVDDFPNKSVYSMPHAQGLTSVKVVDYDMDAFITFQAEIQYPEDEGVVQVEEFGVSARDYGGVYYGLVVESINDQTREHISIDLLSRLLVDVADDSSTLLGSLLSHYQSQLLGTVYAGNADDRPKFNVIIANSFDLPEKIKESGTSGNARAFCALLRRDKEYDNELKQVIGDTQGIFPISDDEALITGTNGLLYVGDPAVSADMLCLLGTLKGMNLFHQAFFRRIFSLSDTLKQLREKIESAHEDPTSGQQVRAMHGGAEQTILILKQVMEFLLESLKLFYVECDKIESSIDLTNAESSRTRLWNLLKLRTSSSDLETRIQDMSKNVKATQFELTQLYNGINNVEQGRSFALSEAINENTKNLEDQVKSAERSSAALEVVQIIMGGTLGFEVLDRWDDTSPFGDVATWGDDWQGQFGPMMWFLLSAFIFCVMGAGITWFSRGAAEAADKVLMLKFKLNKKVYPAKMYRYLMKKPLAAESYDQFKQDMRKIAWNEEGNPGRWTNGVGQDAVICTPDIVMQYDHKWGYLIQVYMQVQKEPGMLSEDEYIERFLSDMDEAGVLVPDELSGIEALPGYDPDQEEEIMKVAEPPEDSAEKKPAEVKKEKTMESVTEEEEAIEQHTGRGRRRSTLAQEKTNKIWDAVKEKAAEEDEKKKKKKAEDFEIVSAPVDEEKES